MIVDKINKNKHGQEIIVNADKSDWGKKWGLAHKNDPRCWCYTCSMKRLDEARLKKRRY